MKLLSLYCPYCGGAFKFDPDTGKQFCYCAHCGQQIVIDDEVKRIEIKTEHRDEAKIHATDVHAQLELERLKLYEQELAEYKKRKAFYLKAGIVWTIIFAIMIIIFVAKEMTIGIAICFIWAMIGTVAFAATDLKKPELLSSKDHKDNTNSTYSG